MMHALIDLSDLSLSADALSEAIRQLAYPDSIAGLAKQVTCIVPAGRPTPSMTPPRWRWATAPGLDEAQSALTRAGRSGSHLLVMLGDFAGAAQAAPSLVSAFDEDPLFGAVHPRFAVNAGRDLLPVEACDGQRLPRSALLSVPARYLLADYLTRCFVLRRELLANLEPHATADAGVAGLFRDYLRRARRIGYRTVVMNSVVVTLPPHVPAERAIISSATTSSPAESDLLGRFQQRDAFNRERRLSALHEQPRRLLFDARNLGTTINGTAKATLGLADALCACKNRGWSVTLVASSKAADTHALERRYPGWTIADRLPSTTFAAAFRPSQPWHLDDLLTLHRLAAVNVYLILDTIAWDIVYGAPQRLDATWRFLARFADGLLFISDFSRQRFLARFPTHEGVTTGVCHLSLDPSDYVDPGAASAGAEGPYWFIVGNEYDHKHVRPTLSLLARSFPTTQLRALGSPAKLGAATVPSGQHDESTMQRLYANAEIVIFPSFYEGFGLPIVNALAYGRTVVARDSALLHEIGGAYRGPGRLVPYATPDELVERLSRLRHGLPAPEVALGTAEGASHSWARAAQIIYECIDRLAAPRAARRERERHEVFHAFEAWTDDKR